MRKNLELPEGIRSLRELCRSSGADYEVVKKRVFKLGWSVEAAISEPVRQRAPNRSNYLLQLYRELYESLPYYDWKPSYNCFRDRIDEGMTPQQAMTCPNRSGDHFKTGTRPADDFEDGEFAAPHLEPPIPTEEEIRERQAKFRKRLIEKYRRATDPRR